MSQRRNSSPLPRGPRMSPRAAYRRRRLGRQLEQGRRERDEARKKLLLAEIKAVIATMHETDKNLIKDMKSEVFDKLRDISKVEKDAKDIIDALKTTNEKDMDIVEDSVKELMKKVERLQVMQFNR